LRRNADISASEASGASPANSPLDGVLVKKQNLQLDEVIMTGREAEGKDDDVERKKNKQQERSNNMPDGALAAARLKLTRSEKPY
jgi:hypothetical protein